MGILDRIGITRKMTRPHLQAFLQKYASSQNTLDIGCGSREYAQLFPQCTTLEIAPRPGVPVDIVGDVHNLHMIADCTYDIVLCTEVLEHLHTPALAISEMYRVLKPGGLLLLSTRFIFPLHDVPGDYFRFTKYGLRHLLQRFTILELTEEVGTVRTLAVLFQRVGFQCETWGLRPLKLLWFVHAWILYWSSFLITKEFGDIRHKQEDHCILASGYYVAARKPCVGIL